MEITIDTGFFAEWYMYIYSGHFIFSLIEVKSKYDFNSILLSVFIILLALSYYKINSPFFFRKYFGLRHILYLGNKEDFFYRNDLLSFSNIFPLIIYSLVLSFFSVFIISDSQSIILKSISSWSVIEQWTVFSVFLLIFFFFRILFIQFIFLFFDFSTKYKKIYLMNFIRVTINISFINIFLSYLSYVFFSFDVGLNVFLYTKILLVLFRPYILFNFSTKILNIKSNKIIFFIFFADLLPSIILFDPIFILNLFDSFLNYLNI